MDRQAAHPSSISATSTDWTDVIDPAREPGNALNRLVCASLGRLTRRAAYKWRGVLGNDAGDVVQSFALKMLEGKVVRKADRTKGQFRTFLRASFDHHVIDWLRQRARAPRAEAELNDAAEDACFDDIWAEELFRLSCEQLEARCQAAGAMDIWGVARDQIVSPLLRGTPLLTYEQLAERHAFASANIAGGKLRTARKWFEQCTRALIQQYAADEREFQAELASYIRALSRLTRLLRPNEPGVAYFYTHLSADLADYDPTRWRDVAELAQGAVPPILTFDDLFQHPAPPLELLKLVKDYAKANADAPAPRALREIAGVMYYASILAALRVWRVSLTALREDELREGVRWCLRRTWLDERTRQIFSPLGR